MKLTLGWALLGSVPLSLLSSLGAAAFANTIELSVLPLLDGPTANCPERIIAHETMQPYFEGGFATNGMIKLRDIATNIRVSQSDRFSTTWVGTLRPEYRNCEASGGIVSIDDESFAGHSYIRVQLANGQVKAILDMTGMGDPNGFTTVTTFRGLRDGNPRWTWGGTD
ncbi:hypothetical protein C7293_08140 [filamentous cyanobacterium CCT1]|nr:hypothetical protein C7293_08140 [filamentous cyanobacterium CCT1]PSN79376.1 hypothetical protein C8B47_11965 [filamentous cyanobacterium CCP4]